MGWAWRIFIFIRLSPGKPSNAGTIHPFSTESPPLWLLYSHEGWHINGTTNFTYPLLCSQQLSFIFRQKGSLGLSSMRLYVTMLYVFMQAPYSFARVVAWMLRGQQQSSMLISESSSQLRYDTRTYFLKYCSSVNNPGIYIVLYRLIYSQPWNHLCPPKQQTKLIHSVITHHQSSASPRRQPTTGHISEPRGAVCWSSNTK